MLLNIKMEKLRTWKRMTFANCKSRSGSNSPCCPGLCVIRQSGLMLTNYRVMEEFLAEDQDGDMDFLDFIVLEELASAKDLLGEPSTALMESGTLSLPFQ